MNNLEPIMDIFARVAPRTPASERDAELAGLIRERGRQLAALARGAARVRNPELARAALIRLAGDIQQWEGDLLRVLRS